MTNNGDYQLGTEILNAAEKQLRRGNVDAGMTALISSLNRFRLDISAQNWQVFCQTIALQHPLRDLVHQSPITRRCYEKPRGYAGDAETLDWIYGEYELAGNVSEFVREVYNFEFGSPVCRSVRERRTILTDKLNEAAELATFPRVLSIACGHLREAHNCLALKSNGFAEFFALDQDAESLAVVEREFRSYGVKPVHQSIRGLLVRKTVFKDLDFVYAAGLYDYLPESAARSLTEAMLEMVKPGGRVLIANFAPNLTDIGYLEAFQDWKLIYRDENDIEDIIENGTTCKTAAGRMFREPAGNLVFLELTKN